MTNEQLAVPAKPPGGRSAIAELRVCASTGIHRQKSIAQYGAQSLAASGALALDSELAASNIGPDLWPALDISIQRKPWLPIRRTGDGEPMRLSEGESFMPEERGNAVNRMDGLVLVVAQAFARLNKFPARAYDINSTLKDIRRSVKRQAQGCPCQCLEEERAKTDHKEPAKLIQSITLPASMTLSVEIDALNQQPRKVMAHLNFHEVVAVTLVLNERAH